MFSSNSAPSDRSCYCQPTVSGKWAAGRRFASRRARIAALLIALAMGTNSANAGMPVVDYLGILWKIRQWIDDVQEYAVEAKRWTQTEEHMKQLEAIFDPLRFSMDMPPGAQLQQVDEDYLVAERCGADPSKFGWKQLVGKVSFGQGANWQAQQHQLCTSIQRTHNRRFNETVYFLTNTMDQAYKEMQRNMDSRKGSDNSAGGVQATQSDTERLGNELNVMAQTWSTRMQAYDATIASLQEQQRILAKAALRGDPKKRLLGDVVQIVTLEKALKLK